MKKLLILGGTNFIGRNLIDELLKDKHFDLTIFNRGISNPELFPELRKIIGNRNTDDINKIAEEEWDYIIDLSCYHPNSLKNILEIINLKLKRYILISSCSVYDNESDKSILRNETAPILLCSDEQRTDDSDESYGNRKAESERVLLASGVKSTILRPALVYGEHDNTDRFYYWLYQLKHHQDILIPNDGKQRFSLSYVKDLVQMIIASLEEDSPSRVFNATSTPEASIFKIIEQTSALMNKYPKRVSAPSTFLESEGIRQWMDLPLWLDCDYYTYSNSIVSTQLKIKFAQLKESIQETIAFYDGEGWPKPVFGISDDKKDSLIRTLRRVN